MKIAPISFGKAVRVNGTREQAFDIARLANEKKVSKEERIAQKQIQAIFDDVTGNTPATVVTYPNLLSYRSKQDNVFIVSGKEAEEAERLHNEAVDAILKSDDKKLSKDEKETRHFYNINGEDYTDEDIRNKRQRDTLNSYYYQLKTMLLSSQENYTISATQNAQGTSIKSVEKEYASVYAVAGTEKQIEELHSILKKSKGEVMIMEATSLYRGRNGEGECTKAANNGENIYFVITDKETINKIRFMEHGWSSLNGISQGIQRFIALDDVKEQAKPLIEAMKH